jgi:hypothetical protein
MLAKETTVLLQKMNIVDDIPPTQRARSWRLSLLGYRSSAKARLKMTTMSLAPMC